MIARRFNVAFVLLICEPQPGPSAISEAAWKSVGFAIGNSTTKRRSPGTFITREKKGCCWYACGSATLLVDTKEQEAYEIDPQTVKPHGEDVEWSTTDKPDQPIGNSRVENARRR